MKQTSIKTLLSSFLAGIFIGIGGIVYLSCLNKYIGAFCFSVGLFFIVENGYSLFTGAIGYSLQRSFKENCLLIVILLGNFIGTYFVALLASLTRFKEVLQQNAIQVAQVKLEDSWYSVLLLAIFCGILIYIGVQTYKKALNGASKLFSILICVFVFILSGYEHCIANMFYFALANCYSWHTILFLLLMILGNSIGGMLVPFVEILMNKVKEK